jgi:xanthine dehydrogenase YagT iron-sulfur-binding subunit
LAISVLGAGRSIAVWVQSIANCRAESHFRDVRHHLRRASLAEKKASEGAQQLSSTGSARRKFIADAALISAGVATSGHLKGARADSIADTATPAPAGTPTLHAQFIVNGRMCDLDVDPRTTLLDVLRENLRLTGTKKGCDRGQCGACTVLVNGRRINSCLSLALSHDGDEVVTIEGLGTPQALHPMQRAFVKYDAFQCGYCTPGQVCSAVALVEEVASGTASAATPDVRQAGPVLLGEAEIRERMSGNLCRCGAYVNIVAAVRSVANRG